MEDFAAHISIIMPAFIVGILVVISHVPLGKEVLSRGIVFLDLAVAQIASLGLVIADFVGFDATHHFWLSQCVAMASAFIGVWLLYFVRKTSAAVQEALIGISFVLAASAIMLLLSKNPHGSEHLNDLLNGQILWVTNQQLIFAGVIYSAAAIALALLKPQGMLFYALFAVCVTLSTQLIGVYLVFASLIIPALLVKLLKLPQWFSYILGVMGYALGLLCSLVLDLPAGPAIIWALLLSAVLLSGFTVLLKGKENAFH